MSYYGSKRHKYIETKKVYEQSETYAQNFRAFVHLFSYKFFIYICKYKVKDCKQLSNTLLLSNFHTKYLTLFLI